MLVAGAEMVLGHFCVTSLVLIPSFLLIFYIFIIMFRWLNGVAGSVAAQKVSFRTWPDICILKKGHFMLWCLFR